MSRPGSSPPGSTSQGSSCSTSGRQRSSPGESSRPCDPRGGHIPGAKHIDLATLFGAASPEAVRELVGAPAGSEVIAYCHSGSRSAIATHVLTAAGYVARNYIGSWHEWSRDPALPAELGAREHDW